MIYTGHKHVLEVIALLFLLTPTLWAQKANDKLLKKKLRGIFYFLEEELLKALMIYIFNLAGSQSG